MFKFAEEDNAAKTARPSCQTPSKQLSCQHCKCMCRTRDRTTQNSCAVERTTVRRTTGKRCTRSHRVGRRPTETSRTTRGSHTSIEPCLVRRLSDTPTANTRIAEQGNRRKLVVPDVDREMGTDRCRRKHHARSGRARPAGRLDCAGLHRRPPYSRPGRTARLDVIGRWLQSSWRMCSNKRSVLPGLTLLVASCDR